MLVHPEEEVALGGPSSSPQYTVGRSPRSQALQAVCGGRGIGSEHKFKKKKRFRLDLRRIFFPLRTVRQ